VKKALLLVAALAVGALAFAASGEAVYQKACSSCHQANGQGIPGVFPPLVKVVPEVLAKGPEGRKVLIHVVLFGMQGELKIGDKTYNSMMPPQRLSEEEIAAVLDYIAKAWDNEKLLPKDYKPFTPDEVKAEKAKSLTPQQVYQEWLELFK